MQDAFGRSFAYLRLSVTQLCNFHCSYCLPDGVGKGMKADFLSVGEIGRLVRAFAGLGLWKVRITGGEPTLRKDFTHIIETVAGVADIKRVATTTNGYKLRENIADWRAAGLQALNVSIDSLDAQNFQRITGHDKLDHVLDGVEESLALGLETKLNAVLLKGLNDHELPAFLDFVKDRPVSLRFIELMRTGDNAAYFAHHHLPASAVTDRLEELGWVRKTRELGAGPAVEYLHADYQGRIGLIAPYAKDFCATCNRLRVSALGRLHLCLFSEMGIPLRSFLQNDDHIPQLQDFVREKLMDKRISHDLHEGLTGGTRRLADIGG